MLGRKFFQEKVMHKLSLRKIAAGKMTNKPQGILDKTNSIQKQQKERMT
jgi:hypothetical protein